MTKQKSDTKQTRDEFLESLFEAYAKARPLSFFRQWRPQDLLAANIPRDWLEENHLLKTNGTATDLPAWVSQRKFAEIATRTFGRSVNQGAVSRAISSEGMADCVTASNGRIRTAAALVWWRQNKAVSGEQVATEAEHRRERQRLAFERETIELAEIKRLSSERWMLTEAHAFEREGSITIFRQERIAQGKKSLDNARATGKAIGMDDAMIERQQALLREIEKEDFKAWQINLVGDPNVPNSNGKLGELDRASWELSEQRKAELKTKI